MLNHGVATDASAQTSHDGTDILLMTGVGYADSTALLAAVNGTSGILDAGGAYAATGDEGYLAIYYNTTNSTTYVVGLDETGSANGDLDTVEVLVQLSTVGLADITNFTADNFTLV